MTPHRLLAACILTTLGTTAAQAQTSIYPSDVGYYGEVAYTPIELKVDGGETSNPQAMRLIVGKEIHKNWAVEAMYITTVSKDNKTLFDGEITNYGIAIKPKVALTESTELFARVGLTHANITATTGSERTGADVSYGMGLQTKFTPAIYGQVDYMNYYHKDGIRAQGYGISLGYRF